MRILGEELNNKVTEQQRQGIPTGGNGENGGGLQRNLTQSRDET
jgi:hypothetical protein